MLVSFVIAGLPIEVLQMEFWVPDTDVRSEHPRYAGKELFREILTCTNDLAILWATRACKDYAIRWVFMMLSGGSLFEKPIYPVLTLLGAEFITYFYVFTFGGSGGLFPQS